MTRMGWLELTTGLWCLSNFSRCCVGYGFRHEHPQRIRLIVLLVKRDLKLGDIEDCRDQGVNLVLLPQLKEMFECAVTGEWQNAKARVFHILADTGKSTRQ